MNTTTTNSAPNPTWLLFLDVCKTKGLDPIDQRVWQAFLAGRESAEGKTLTVAAVLDLMYLHGADGTDKAAAIAEGMQQLTARFNALVEADK